MSTFSLHQCLYCPFYLCFKKIQKLKISFYPSTLFHFPHTIIFFFSLIRTLSNSFYYFIRKKKARIKQSAFKNKAKVMVVKKIIAIKIFFLRMLMVGPINKINLSFFFNGSCPFLHQSF